MKKKQISDRKGVKIFALLLALIVASCSNKAEEEEETLLVGPLPYFTILVDIVDHNGNNLLDPEFEGNILDMNMYLSWKEFTISDGCINPSRKGKESADNMYLNTFTSGEERHSFLESKPIFYSAIEQCFYDIYFHIEDLDLSFNYELELTMENKERKWTARLDGLPQEPYPLIRIVLYR